MKQSVSGLIDAHVHLWDTSRQGHKGRDVPGFPFPNTVDGQAETLLSEMNRYGVVRAIAVQTPWWQHDDRYLLDVADLYPDRFTVVGCTPFILSEADPDAIASRIGRDGMHGLRMHISEPGALDTIIKGQFNSVFQRLSEHQLPVLFIGRAAGTFDVYKRIARIFPDLNIVVDHIGYVSLPLSGARSQINSLLNLSIQQRVYVKLAIHHQHSREPYPWRDLIPFQQRLVSEFGANRLMWGSNWPMREPTYAERLGVMSEHFPFHSDEDREWILGRTAETVWPAGTTVPLEPADRD